MVTLPASRDHSPHDRRNGTGVEERTMNQRLIVKADVPKKDSRYLFRPPVPFPTSALLNRPAAGLAPRAAPERPSSLPPSAEAIDAFAV